MASIKTYIEKQNPKTLFGLFLIIWLLINFLQVIFTEVMNDEAYYYLWGQNLAWGYYDHPPMVAFMTYISDLLFNGNLSVRFTTVICQFFTLILIWKIVGEKEVTSLKITLFFIIVASMIMFTAYGFTTAPDVPFLFFSALFLLYYKRYLENDSWLSTLLLGIAMAGMVYSKYHAALVILLIVISNLRLLANYKSWIALGIAVVLLIPHIYWQLSMDFPGLQYHLSARSSAFKWNYFFEYLPNQLVVFNPLTLGAFIYVLIKYRPSTTFERGMYFLTIGFLVFFWLMSFRGHVEPHWTVVCTIPMIVLIYQYSLRDKKLLKFVKNWITPSLILILIARIVLTTNLLPPKLGFSGKDESCKAIEEVAGDLPVVFTGSFQKPSTYSFFNQKESFVLSGVNSRQTQFDVWQKELNYQGKSVFICSHIEGKSQEYIINGHSFHGYFTDNFQSVNRLEMSYELPETNFSIGDTVQIQYTIINPTEYDIDFNHAEFPVKIRTVYGKRKYVQFSSANLLTQVAVLPANGEISDTVKTVVPDLDEGDYRFTLTLDNKICPAMNAPFTPITIKNDR